jgi:hypothetical protein
VELEQLVKELVAKLDSGLTLDWTDIRIYIIVTLSSLIGGIISAFFTKYFGKRGEINAIKKDLDEITKIQAEIKSKISTDAFIEQNWWDLKRETYWNVTKALNNLSDACWNVISYCFDEEKLAITDPDIYVPHVNKLVTAVDNYLEYTGISHIVMSDEGKKVISEILKEINTEDLSGKKIQFDDLIAMRQSINLAYDKIIDIARKDLKNENA